MRINYSSVALIVIATTITHLQATSQESDAFLRRSDCKSELFLDVETTSITKLVDPADSIIVTRPERIRFVPTIEREERYLCVRKDSTYRMEVRYKQPVNPSTPEYIQLKSNQGIPTETKYIIDRNEAISYDVEGNVLTILPFDQSPFEEMMFHAVEQLLSGRQNAPLYIQDIIQKGGTVEYLSPTIAKLIFTGERGGTISQLLDLELGVFTALTIYDAHGELAFRDVYEHEFEDGKTRLKRIFHESWDELPNSKVKIVTETTEIYFKYEYTLH